MIDIDDGSNWVKLSVAMSSVQDTMAMVETQYLCRLNSRLNGLEVALLPLDDTDIHGHLLQGERLTEIAGQSWLWVLGAYEVFRRAKTRLGVQPEFKVLSDEISEIRMVLAKQEARSAKPDTWQRPKHIMTTADRAFGWGYWNRCREECQFIRAEFAARWLEFGAAYIVPR